jgi:hypothetical protein
VTGSDTIVGHGVFELAVILTDHLTFPDVIEMGSAGRWCRLRHEDRGGGRKRKQARRFMSHKASQEHRCSRIDA